MLGSPYHRICWKNKNLMYTVEPCLTELWSTEAQAKRKSYEINKKAKLTLKHPCNTHVIPKPCTIGGHFRELLKHDACRLCGGIDLPETGQLVLLPAVSMCLSARSNSRCVCWNSRQ